MSRAVTHTTGQDASFLENEGHPAYIHYRISLTSAPFETSIGDEHLFLNALPQTNLWRMKQPTDHLVPKRMLATFQLLQNEIHASNNLETLNSEPISEVLPSIQEIRRFLITKYASGKTWTLLPPHFYPSPNNSRIAASLLIPISSFPLSLSP